MPLMNISFTAIQKPFDQYGQVRENRFRYTGPTSYATGGDTTRAGAGATTDSYVFQLGTVANFPAGIALDANGANPRLVVWRRSTERVLWFVPSTGAEVANGTDLSGYTVELAVVGS